MISHSILLSGQDNGFLSSFNFFLPDSVEFLSNSMSTRTVCLSKWTMSAAVFHSVLKTLSKCIKLFVIVSLCKKENLFEQKN